jgi:hypothetical protein
VSGNLTMTPILVPGYYYRDSYWSYGEGAR